MAKDTTDWEQFAVTDEVAPQEQPVEGSKSSIVKNLENLLAQGKAGARGYAEGITSGLADELYGVGSTIAEIHDPTSYVDSLKQLLGDEEVKPTDLITRYKEARDASRESLKKQKEEFPITTGAGEFAGALTQGAALAGTGAVPLLASGALQGLGTSQADLLGGDVEGVAKDVALGAGTGLALGKVGQKVGGALLGTESANAALAARSALGGAAGAYLAPEDQMIEGATVGAVGANILPKVGSNLIKGLSKTGFGQDVALGLEEGLAGRSIIGPEAAERARQGVISVADEITGAAKTQATEVGTELGKIRKELADYGVVIDIDDTFDTLATKIKEAQIGADAQAKANRTLKKLAKIIVGKEEVAPEAVIPSSTATLSEALEGEERGALKNILESARSDIGKTETQTAKEVWEGMGSELETQKAKYSALTDLLDAMGADGSSAGKTGIKLIENVAIPAKAADQAAVNQFEETMSKALGTDKSGDLLTKAKRASRVADLTGSYTKDPEVSVAGGKLYSMAKVAPAKAANVAGQLYSKVTGGNIPKSAAKKALELTPESLQQLGSKLKAAVPGASAILDRTMDGLTSGDAVKRNAAMFMLMQNPDYRKIVSEHVGEPIEDSQE